jgi:hypothetical protein
MNFFTSSMISSMTPAASSSLSTVFASAGYFQLMHFEKPKQNWNKEEPKHRCLPTARSFKVAKSSKRRLLSAITSDCMRTSSTSMVSPCGDIDIVIHRLAESTAQHIGSHCGLYTCYRSFFSHGNDHRRARYVRSFEQPMQLLNGRTSIAVCGGEIGEVLNTHPHAHPHTYTLTERSRIFHAYTHALTLSHAHASTHHTQYAVRDCTTRAQHDTAASMREQK